MREPIPYTAALRRELIAATGRDLQGRRRRNWFVISLVTATLLLASAAVATLRWPEVDDVPAGVEPVQLGPERVITSGSSDTGKWTMLAVESDKGLCIHIEGEGFKSGGCGYGVPENTDIGYDETTLAVVTERLVFGPVITDADYVRIRLSSGEVRRVEVMRDDEFDVGFFVFPLEAQDGDVVAITAYDAGGTELATLRL